MIKPSIEGTYQLVRRELPDGTIQFPPNVKGIITYTNEIRNYSSAWEDDKGKFYAECYVARYTLTDKEYTETSEYLVVTVKDPSPSGGQGVSYDLSSKTIKSPVSFDGKRISFALPHPFEKVLSIILEFDEGGLKAIGKDRFIDYFDKIL